MDKLIYIFILVILIIFMPSRYDDFNHILNFNYSIIYVFLVTIFFLNQRREDGNWLRFDVIFLIGFAIVHFEIPFLASIGIEPEVPSFIWPNQQVVNFATWMSLISIVFWMLGYSFANNKNYPGSDSWKNLKINYTLYDLILLAAFILFLLTVGPSLYRGEYAGAQIWGAGAVYPFLILRIMLNLRVIYFIMQFKGDFNLKRIYQSFFNNKIFFIVLFVYLFLFLMSGKRGNIMQILLVSAGAYAIFVRSISFPKVIACLCAGAFLFTILSLGRGVGDNVVNSGNIFTRGYSAFEESENKGITADLSSTVRIQYTALDIVPEVHPYLYGITFFVGILSIIPFLGGSIVKAFDIPVMYQGTAEFFTIIIGGPNPTSGEGSEVLSDIYINFGIYGVFIIMFLFGLYSNIIYKKALGKNIIFVFIYLVLLYTALTINRESVLSPLKDIAYIIFFHILFSKVVKNKVKSIQSEK